MTKTAQPAGTRVAHFVAEYGIVLILVLIIFALSVLTPLVRGEQYFLTSRNLLQVLLQASINTIIAVGMTFVITSGGIDLSVGSTVALAGVGAGMSMNAGAGPYLGFLIAVLIGGACGAFNGLLITKLRLQPFIVTLGTLGMFRGLALILSEGRPIYGFNRDFLAIFAGQLFGIPVQVVVAVVVVTLFWFVLTRTRFGKYTVAVGGNETTAERTGIPVRWYKFQIYTLIGLLAGVAAALLTARLSSADPTAGQLFELDAIAATIMGGNGRRHGRGSTHHQPSQERDEPAQRADVLAAIRARYGHHPGRHARRLATPQSEPLRRRRADHTSFVPFAHTSFRRRSMKILQSFTALALSAASLASAQDETFRIGALIKNDSNPYFLTMREGFEFAAERYGVDIVVGSTPTEDATAEQLAILETWLNEGTFDAFIVTPFRPTSLDSALARATEAGIPVINTDELIPEDSAVAGGIDISARIASNNVRAGSLAGQMFAERLPEGSQVAVIEGAAGTTSSIDRVQGFTDAAEAAGLEVVSSQPADWDRAQAFDVTTNTLQGNPEIQGVFAANDGMGLGAVEAVQAAGLAGEVIVASVDAIPEAIEAVREGRLAGTVAQYPDEMAVLAVEAMLKVLKGRPISPEIEAPVVLLTEANIDTAGSRLGEPQIGDIQLGALTKNLSNEFFLTMAEGYERAASELGVSVTVGSTPTEDATAEQLAILEGWLNEGGYDGFSVTPFRATSLESALVQATEAATPIVNIDELIPRETLAEGGVSVAQQIASNNVRAGSLAGQRVLELVNEGAQVAVIEGAAGTTSSIDRVQGFTDTVTEGGLEVVSSQPADWDRAQAFDVTTNILQGNPEVVAIFAANDGMGLGAVEAVQAAGLSGAVVVFSVDAVPEALEAVRDGRLGGTVAQYPDEMAYLAVESLIKLVEGRPVAPTLESPVALITQDNLPE